MVIAHAGIRLNSRSNLAQLDFVNKLIFVKEYEEARSVIEEMLEDSTLSKNLLVHLRRIELGVKLDQLESIRDEYRSLIESNPEDLNYRVCYTLTEQHAEMIDPEEAITHFQSLLKSYGPHAAIYYGIAFSMEVSGNYDRALYSYEQCVQADPDWYPGYFGMSQIYYHLGDSDKGDYFFYMFEEMAPYNVYGNFETHRSLSQEFSENEEYERAELAMTSLSGWWIDNKGYCPIEIQIYERYALAKISDLSGDKAKCVERKAQGTVLARGVLRSGTETDNVLFFIAKTLEEFDENEFALEIYKRILSHEASDPEMVQKIGTQFLSSGQYGLACDLFEIAYQHHPDHEEIRFCKLVSSLRLKGVPVEQYLLEKDRVCKLIDQHGDKVEILSLLHALLAKYDSDPDIQGHVGDMYLSLGNEERAGKHFERLYHLDQYSISARLRYVVFQMQYGDIKLAHRLISSLSENEIVVAEHLAEFLWLKSNMTFQNNDYRKSLEYLNRVLKFDPWNVAYLVQQSLTLSAVAKDKVSFNLVDSVLMKLSQNIEEGLDWVEFDQNTVKIKQGNLLELAYARDKLRFLYSNGSKEQLNELVNSACNLDASKSAYDFLKLLNTNFDSPNIYWALGKVYKELWQLETAGVWFEQVLNSVEATDEHKSLAYREIADCYVWQEVMPDRAVEYAKISLDLSDQDRDLSMRTLAHSLLRKGEVRKAEVYLDELEERDPEVIYLKGLVFYRNGLSQKANETWKPLLSLRSENLRFHNMKQKIMKFYFDKEPYQSSN